MFSTLKKTGLAVALTAAEVSTAVPASASAFEPIQAWPVRVAWPV
jgi:hypothetical protein